MSWDTLKLLLFGAARPPQIPVPNLLNVLLGSISERQPFATELNYFKNNLNVAGMATEDKKIAMNPFSALSLEQKEAVRANERLRIHMRQLNPRIIFKLTPEQQTRFKGYGTPQDIKETVVGRFLSNDPTAGIVPEEQQDVAYDLLRKLLGKR